ncbi:MAG: hypothetical protein RJA70_4251, partial [Pseudomonadota bacterium]
MLFNALVAPSMVRFLSGDLAPRDRSMTRTWHACCFYHVDA